VVALVFFLGDEIVDIDLDIHDLVEGDFGANLGGLGKLCVQIQEV